MVKVWNFLFIEKVIVAKTRLLGAELRSLVNFAL